MDFTIVKRQIISQYISLYGSDRENDTWSLEACIKVFRYFYRAYYQAFGCPHPYLRNQTIREIISGFPRLSGDGYLYGELLAPKEYPVMIDAYFEQDFGPDCDYSIQHFMSGVIRALRYYEEEYYE